MKRKLVSAIILVTMLLFSASNFAFTAEAATKYNSKQLKSEFVKIAKRSKGVVSKISIAQQQGFIEIDVNVNRKSWNKLSSKKKKSTLANLNKEIKRDIKRSTIWAEQVKWNGSNVELSALYYFKTSSHRLKYFSSM